jgi:hypothetical protein
MAPVRTVRGKTAGAFPGAAGTFQWTRSVQAFSLFWIKQALQRRAGEAADLPLLSGGRGSAAASLDYALSKPPRWIVEVCGAEKNGEARFRRIVRRSNPEMKSPGPVSLHLSPAWARDGAEFFLWDGRSIESREELEALGGAIEKYWTAKSIEVSDRQERAPALRPALGGMLPDKAVLERIFCREAASMVRRVDIFQREGMAQLIDEVRRDASLARLLQNLAPFLPLARCESSSSLRLGIGAGRESAAAEMLRDKPLRIVVPVALYGSLAIFRRLRAKHGWDLKVDSGFPHAVEVVQHLAAGRFSTPPDAVVLGLPPAAMLLNLPNGGGYRPLMFMPSISHRVLAGRGAKLPGLNADRGEYWMVDDPPSTSVFYYEELSRSGRISKRGSRVIASETDETFLALRDGGRDVRAVTFFPFYDLNALKNGCRFLDEPQHHRNTKVTVLFAHESLARDAKRCELFERGVRDAWLDLRSSDARIASVTREVLADNSYLTLVERFSGFCHLSC